MHAIKTYVITDQYNLFNFLKNIEPYADDILLV